MRLNFKITSIEEILAGVKNIDYKMTVSHQFRLGNLENKYKLALNNLNFVIAQIFQQDEGLSEDTWMKSWIMKSNLGEPAEHLAFEFPLARILIDQFDSLANTNYGSLYNDEE